MLRSHSGGDWGGVFGGGAEGCAGAGDGDSSHTDSSDGTEVFRRGGGGGAKVGMNTDTLLPVPHRLAHKQMNAPLLHLCVCVCVLCACVCV